MIALRIIAGIAGLMSLCVLTFHDDETSSTVRLRIYALVELFFGFIGAFALLQFALAGHL